MRQNRRKQIERHIFIHKLVCSRQRIGEKRKKIQHVQQLFGELLKTHWKRVLSAGFLSNLVQLLRGWCPKNSLQDKKKDNEMYSADKNDGLIFCENQKGCSYKVCVQQSSPLCSSLTASANHLSLARCHCHCHSHDNRHTF